MFFFSFTYLNTNTKIEKKRCIVLVEDNPGDIMLAKEVIMHLGLDVDLTVLMDGEQVIEFLEEAQHLKKGWPDLILLDLNLPKKDGREVLKYIKTHQKLRRIPVCILTTSNAEHDINETYSLNANSYLTKPLDFNQFLETFKELNDFWFNTVLLPERKEY
ncbi:MAG: response regulator [Chitinophagaceae bacterium]|nr:MAG: response regulator [Chitinophagaceae bacterium]